MILLLNIYFFFYSGFASFWSYLLGFGDTVSNASPHVALGLGLLFIVVLAFQQKIRVNSITYIILGYILLRGFVLLGFAAYHGYDILAYLLPLKNWLVLLAFFVIGQSIEISFARINHFLFIHFGVFVICALACELGPVSSLLGLSTVFSPSRIPFLTHRIPLDLFLTTYIYMISTMQYLSKQIPLKRYLLMISMIVATLFVSQIQQMITGIILTSLCISFIYLKRRELFGNRILFHTASILVVAGIAVLSFYFFFTHSYQSIYFSIFRRNLLVDYVKDKVVHYPIAGYPIPSPVFSDNIPYDISFNFFDFDFNNTIFPSDIPALFIPAEEGVLGILYVILLLWLCYRKNPNTKYFILVMLATVSNLRLYYLIPLVSSFTYFMLGYFTSVHRCGVDENEF